MEVAVTTDVGAGQRFNDDAWCHEQLHRNVTLLAVADGFGRPHGMPSASIVLDTVRDVIRRELRRATFRPRGLSAGDIRELLAGAFAAGNERLLQLGGGNDDRVSSASTCTLILIVDNQAFVGHVGDSRAYLSRRGELVQLTTDESLLPELVRSGATPGQPPHRHMPALLARALGVEPTAAVPAKIAHYTLHSHDSLLLCTDGVSRSVGFSETQTAIGGRDGAQAAADRIVALARGAGSVDNATVLLARNATVHGPPPDGTTRVRSLPVQWLAAALACAVLCGVAATAIRTYWLGDAHLYLAADASGDLGLYAGVPGSFAGLPLHIERESFAVAVSSLAAAQQAQLRSAVIPVSSADSAAALVARWQARSRH